MKQSVDGVDSQGKPVHTSFSAKYDGKVHPVTGNPDADTIAVTRTGPNSARATMKKGGKVVQQTRRTVSKDGKSLTLATRGTNAKGEKIEMTVPIHLIGEAVGLKEEGAVLTQAMREIKVLCEPANTPDSIDFDVTNLGAGESIHVSDLKVGEGIEIHEAPDTVVASIVTVKEVELEPQIAEAGEPAVVGEEPAPTEGGEE